MLLPQLRRQRPSGNHRGNRNLQAKGGRQMPGFRLLSRPLRTLPEPIFVMLFEEMAVPNPVPAPNVLLFTQAPVDTRCKPCTPCPLMAADVT